MSGATDSNNESLQKSDHVDFGKACADDGTGEQKYCQQILEESLASVNSAKLTAAETTTTKAAATATTTAQNNVIDSGDGNADSIGNHVTQNKQSNHRSSKHKPPNGYSNGNSVINRDDALILLPDGIDSTHLKSNKGSDIEHSDTDVSVSCTYDFFFASPPDKNTFFCAFCRAISIWVPV